MIRKIACPNSE